jgi:hypothetical protein
VFRNLRVFAVDPDVAANFDTALFNEMRLRIPWEDLARASRRIHWGGGRR